MATTYIVYNRKSGSKDRQDEIKAACSKSNLGPEFIPISGLKSKLTEVGKNGVSTIVAAGGDGTVSAVAGELASSNLKMGVIPVGTLNHFAKDMHIPVGVDEAVAALAGGKSVKVDTVALNDLVFVNNSSIGVYPDAVRTRDKHAHRVGKWPAAVWGIGVHLRRPRAYRFELEIDGKKIYCRTPFIFVGNNNYNISQVGITNRTELTQGKLCIYIVKTDSRRHLMRLAAKAFLGKVEAEQSFDSYIAGKLIIRAPNRKTIDVAWDGEVKRLAFPLVYKTQPKSLTVIVP